MNFVSYHPYFKLGMAYYNMGRFDAALQAFDTEEGFGAIAQSADLQNLQAFRRLSEEGMQSAATARQEQIAGAIDRSLQEAEVLQQQGRLDEAMASVAKGLALDSGNTRALKAMDELRSLVAEGERQRDIDNRVATLLGEGRELLASSNYQDAAAKFNQALSLEPAEAEVQVVRGLLDEAQSKRDKQAGADQHNGKQRSGFRPAPDVALEKVRGRSERTVDELRDRARNRFNPVEHGVISSGRHRPGRGKTGGHPTMTG